MKTRLESIAREIINTREIEKAAAAAQAVDKNNLLRKEILDAFKFGFTQQLDLLDEAGVTYEAHLKDNAYPTLYGSYIQFNYRLRTLKMDFNDSYNYRYEYTKKEQRGQMVFGLWPKNDFIVWIYQNLIEPANADLPVCNNETHE